VSDMIERKDGTLVLRTNADPAGAGHQMLGWRRYSVGLDVGGRGDDPSALTIIKSESRPYLTGNGWEQSLTTPQYSVVYTETVKLGEATDLVDWTVSKLRQLRNWRLTFDATGLGAPLKSMFDQAKVPTMAVTMTAGSSINRTGDRATVSKNVLFENAATKLETGELVIAHDLPEREDLIREISSVEFAVTSAGNMTLQGGGRGHHADRFVSTALALIAETHLPEQRMTTTKLVNYW
jgi:hypothetical protein